MSENIKYLAIRFETNNKCYTFSSEDLSIKENDLVVVETVKGEEIGKVIKAYEEKPNLNSEIKPIIRLATAQDIKQDARNKNDAIKVKEIAQNHADILGLSMNFLSAEYTLDRSKVTLVYVADSRVDFRDLLKVLASDLHCRIELRQIGSRDKAKLVSGIGVCGRELCCARHLEQFDRITVNMAKNQFLAVNMQKLSGQCGNLLCCLKYEDEAYKEARKDLPKLNSPVEYQGGKYRITSINIIAQNCRLENPNESVTITLDELKAKAKYNKPKAQEHNKTDDE